jgi:hypothetical protein
MKLDLHHRKIWKAFNITKVAIAVLLMLVLVGSGLYEPHWKFDHSTLRQEVIDTVRMFEEVNTGEIELQKSRNFEAQKARQDWLVLNATLSELNALLDYPNASVKLTAYQALLRRDGQDHFELLLGALNEEPSYYVYIPKHGIPEQGQFCPLGVFLVDHLVVTGKSRMDSSSHLKLTDPERQALLSRRDEIYGPR